MSDAGGPRPERVKQASDLDRRTWFLAACVDTHMPEATRLAGTVEKWWPEIEGFLKLCNTNARTEGYNRVIKQINRG